MKLSSLCDSLSVSTGRHCSNIHHSAPSFRGVQVGQILQQLGRSAHFGYKKLEGPLQKAALVPVVNISGFQLRLRNKKRRFDCQENVLASIPGEVRSNTDLAEAKSWRSPIKY